MSNAVKKNTVFAAVIEDTENVYKAPQADTDYVQTLVDGAEMVPSKELLERNVFTGSIGKNSPRTGMKSVTGSMPVEMRAAEVEGEAPEYDSLMQSALGSRRQRVAGVVDATDSGGTHTTSRIYLPDADSGKYAIGDIVTVKVAGGYHTSPISGKSDIAGDVYIDLLVPADSAFVDSQVIAAVTTYVTADSGHPSLSISKYIEEARLEQAAGCRVTSMSLENFSTGQLASWNFGFEGMSFDQSLTPQPHDPNFSDQLPPIILEACVYQNGSKIQINDLNFSLENVLGFVTSTCSPNGKISSRATERNISGDFNPYKQDDDVSQFDRFNTNEEFSLFAMAKLPTGVAGEYSGVVAMYLPKCIITELGESDADGMLQENITFIASRGADGESEELYVSFS